MELVTFESETFKTLAGQYENMLGLLDDFIKKEKKRNDKLLLSAMEVAEMTGYNEKTIRLKKYEIGFFTVGKEVMFKPVDVEAWIERNYIKPRRK